MSICLYFIKYLCYSEQSHLCRNASWVVTKMIWMCRSFWTGRACFSVQGCHSLASYLPPGLTFGPLGDSVPQSCHPSQLLVQVPVACGSPVPLTSGCSFCSVWRLWIKCFLPIVAQTPGYDGRNSSFSSQPRGICLFPHRLLLSNKCYLVFRLISKCLFLVKKISKCVFFSFLVLIRYYILISLIHLKFFHD